MCEQMMFADEDRDFAISIWHFQSHTQILDQLHAAMFVRDVSRPFFGWCRAFTKIMHKCCEAHDRISAESRRLLQHHHCVNARVDFRMPLLGLRHTEERIYFREDHPQRVGIAQYLKESPGRG